jgi:HEAT repeat protein
LERSFAVKKWALILVVIFAGLLVVGLFIEPTGVALGYLRGESFYDGRPSGYWARQLAGDPAASSAAIEKLERGKGAVVGVLAELLQGQSRFPSEVRYTAAEILGRIGPDADAASQALLDALNDPDPHVRLVAAAALPKTGVPAADAVPALTKRLAEEPSVVTARALSEYRGQAIEALPTLIKTLENQELDSETRWNAARTLGKIGPEGTEAIPALVEALEDKESTVREHSAEALGDIGPPAAEAIPDLVAVLGDPATRVRRDAVRSLGQIGPASRVAVAEMKELLKDPEEMVREAARNALLAVAPEELPDEKPSNAADGAKPK